LRVARRCLVVANGHGRGMHLTAANTLYLVVTKGLMDFRYARWLLDVTAFVFRSYDDCTGDLCIPPKANSSPPQVEELKDSSCEQVEVCLRGVDSCSSCGVRGAFDAYPPMSGVRWDLTVLPAESPRVYIRRPHAIRTKPISGEKQSWLSLRRQSDAPQVIVVVKATRNSYCDIGRERLLWLFL
jgi:hypothetical protein